MTKSVNESRMVVVFIFLLIYIPGYTRGTVTFHVEDFVLVFLVFWRYNHPSSVASMLRNLRARIVRVFVLCEIGFVVWTNVINILYAERLVEVVYGAALFRSIVFVMWILSLEQVVETLREVISWFPIFGLIQQIIVFIQSKDLLGLNDWLTPLYSTVVENSIYSLKGLRADGTYANPNDAAIGVSFFATGSIVCWSEQRSAIRANVWYLGTVFSALYAVLVLCKSRTGAAANLFVIAAFSLFAIITRKKVQIVGVIFWLLIVVPVATVNTFLSNEKLRGRFSVFTGATALTDEGSFAERLRMWKDGVDLLSGNTITMIGGIGVGGLARYGWLDSGYFTYIFISGLFGLTLVVGSLAFGLVQGLRQQSPAGLYLVIVVLQIFIVTVSHPLVMKDKLWIPILTIFLYLAFVSNKSETNRAEVEKNVKNDAILKDREIAAPI